jgi:hypothetical protein
LEPTGISTWKFAEVPYGIITLLLTFIIRQELPELYLESNWAFVQTVKNTVFHSWTLRKLFLLLCDS